MPTIIDSHVHFYPHYDVHRTVNRQLTQLTPGNLALWMVADRSGQDSFSLLNATLVEPHTPGGAAPGLTCYGSAVVGLGTPPRLFIFRGAQVVTTEGIECLIWPHAKLQDRAHSLTDLIGSLPAALVILPWSPGKWRGTRKDLIAEVCAASRCDVLLGDIPMRIPWAPSTLTRLSRHGPLVRGSDPLPIVGEESLIGSFGVVSNGLFDPSNPLDSAKELLRSAREPHGRHGAAIVSVSRWVRLVFSPKCTNAP